MVVEVRDYRTKPGRRAEFVRLFHERTAPLQQSLGIAVFGPLLDRDDPDRLLWLRGFPSMAERAAMRATLYGSPLWLDELAPLVMPLLADTSCKLADAACPLLDDFGGP